MGTHLTSREDGIFIAWTINHVSHSLQTGADLFQVPTFYPFKNTLAYSDPFLTSGLMNIPLTWVTDNIVLMHNVHLLLGTILTFISMWLLGRQLFTSRWAAAFSALIFTFSSMHLHYLVHLHTYLVAGLPLTLYFLLRWAESKKSVFLFLSTIVFILQAINAPMTFFFMVSLIICLLIADKTLRQMIRRNWLLVAMYGVLTLLTIGLVYWPYFQVSQEFKYTRSIRDAAHFAHSLNRMIEPELWLLYGAVSGILFFRGNTPLEKKHLLIFPLLAVATGAVLMLGPALKVNDQTFKIFGWPMPLPYAVLYYVIPGFKAFRATSRWITVFNFGLSLWVGWAVAEYQLPTISKYRHQALALIFLGLTTFFWFGNYHTIKVYPIPLEPPTIYQVLKNRPERVAAEFPVLSWRMQPYNYLENDRLLYQAYHQKVLYNGVSGFTPPIREERWEWLWREFPSPETIDHLKNEGVEVMIVHYDVYEEMSDQKYTYAEVPTLQPTAIRDSLRQLKVEEIECLQDKCLYSLL